MRDRAAGELSEETDRLKAEARKREDEAVDLVISHLI